MASVRTGKATTRLAPASSRATQRSGQIIGERYRLEELLERGAMGSVWRAEQINLRSPVAIKFLEPSLIGDPEMNDRFMQEARSAAAVRSMHVVQIFDYGSDGNVPYIAMELLEGENLDARLSKCGTLTPIELEKIFNEVARGIGQAHAMGVIHRDVKPGNIFLARDGDHEVTKLIDFGIAKVKADALKFTHMVGTQVGTLLGTPQYMSPEQLRGSTLIDHRTDLWALAIIACECLTGRYPFSGTTIGDLTVQICTEKPLAPSSLGLVPPGFDQWFFKGTAKRAFRRFDSVEEMAGALSKILLAAGDRPLTASWPKQLQGLAQRIEIRRAWQLTASQMSRLSTWTRQRASGWGPRIARAASVARALPHTLASSGLPAFLRPLLSRNGLIALGLLLVFALVLWWPTGEATVQPVPEAGPSQTIHAASPAPARPPAAAAPAPSTAPAPSSSPASSGADLGSPAEPTPPNEQLVSSGAADAGTAPEPTITPSEPRPTRRVRVQSAVDRKAPLGPMGLAMQRAGARILQGEGLQRETRARAAASAQTRARISETPAPARPAPATAAPKNK
jgi:eukaryotic-like serine/threonine-protein kinase